VPFAPSEEVSEMRSIHELLGKRLATRASRIIGALAFVGGLLSSEVAAARPGTHPIVVNTWDARASSVVLE
jgi:hypothetical protein